MGKISRAFKTLHDAVGQHWQWAVSITVPGSYAVVSAILTKFNLVSENEHLGLLAPSVSKISYTIALLSVLLVIWFWKYAHGLRLKLEPSLVIEQIVNEVFRPSDAQATVQVSILIRNTGQIALTNCIVKFDALSGDEKIFGHFKSRALRTSTQGEQGRQGAFNLRGGEAKEIPILLYKVTKGDTFTRLVVYFEDGTPYEFDPDDRNVMSIGLYSEGPFNEYKLRLDRLADGSISVTKGA